MVGRRYVSRTDHSLTSQMVIEAPDIATHDYISTLRSGDLIEWGLTHGLIDGNIIEMASPKCQITDIAESKEDGILMWTLSLYFNHMFFKRAKQGVPTGKLAVSQEAS